MNAFRQHIPGFVETDPPFSFEFNTVTELLSNEWIAKWKGDPSFYRYSVSLDEEDAALMAEFDHGRQWWVLGYFRNREGLDSLPAWYAQWDRSVAAA